MSNIRWLRACWECDGCGKDFIVEIDTGWKPPAEWDFVDIARDAVAGGSQVTIEPLGKHHITTHVGLVDSCSIQHDMMLCKDCTRIADEIGDDNYQPSKDEILACLGATK
jgi:hypothetical protein